MPQAMHHQVLRGEQAVDMAAEMVVVMVLVVVAVQTVVAEATVFQAKATRAVRA